MVVTDPRLYVIDKPALLAKYLQERDKRLREDGELQYHEIDGEFAHYIEHDPYVAPGFTRPSSSASTSATGTVAADMFP